MLDKRGQISTEYLVIVGFITFAVITALGIALFYVTEIKDVIKVNQVENFANKLISSSESIFFSGEPSQIEMIGYLPQGVTSITLNSKELIFQVETSSGTNIRAFPSRVTISGTISTDAGVKKLNLLAQDTQVIIL
jgi:Flp pilus assembly pilin Flp